MKVSFFETGRYAVPADIPREWPVPSGAYDPAVGAKAYQGMVERARFVQKLGFDWISVWDHFYPAPSPLDGDCFEGIACHAALAALTTRPRVGSLVYSTGYRHPADFLAFVFDQVDDADVGKHRNDKPCQGRQRDVDIQ